MHSLNLGSAIVPVTGAASGIGLAICRLLRGEGAKPLLLDVNRDMLQAALGEIYPEGNGIRNGYVVDVRDSQAVDECFRRIRDDHGLITHAVANAGISAGGQVTQVSDETWHRVLDINLSGAFYTCRAAARQLIERRAGAIVTMGSVAGLMAKKARVAYASSKAGVIHMTRALAMDLGEYGIRVNGVAPGIVATPIQAMNAPEAVAAVAGRSALARQGSPEEIANVVAFLLSDKASFVTGHTVVADGGLTISYA